MFNVLSSILISLVSEFSPAVIVFLDMFNVNKKGWLEPKEQAIKIEYYIFSHFENLKKPSLRLLIFSSGPTFHPNCLNWFLTSNSGHFLKMGTNCINIPWEWRLL